MEGKESSPLLEATSSEPLRDFGELRGTVHRWLTKHDAGFVLPDEAARQALGMPKGMRLRVTRGGLSDGFQPEQFTAGTWVGFRPAADPSPASAHAGRQYCAVQVRPLRPEEYEDALYRRGVCGGAGLAGVGPSFGASAGEPNGWQWPAWAEDPHAAIPSALLSSARQQLRGYYFESSEEGSGGQAAGCAAEINESDFLSEALAPSALPESRPHAYRPLVVGLAATFALDTLEGPLHALLARAVGLPAAFRWVPYGTVLEALTTDVSGKLHCGEDVSVVALYIRLEDLVYNHPEVRAQAPQAADASLVAAAAAQLRRALATSSGRPGAALHLVCFCPPSPLAARDATLGAAALHRFELALLEAFKDEPRITCLTSAALQAEYCMAPPDPPAPSSPVSLTPTKPWLPAGAGDDQLHVPYRPEGFLALAWATARLLCRALSPGLKVLCLDCDNTLWDGAVAEVGPQGVGLRGPHRLVQEVAVQLQRRGVLLALVSRNEEADVLAVFEQRAAELALPLEAVVARRIGWKPKSAALASIAEELRLGLDAFAFLDDSPVECGEVQQRLPAVKVGLLPHDARRFGAFLRQWWPLDAPLGLAAPTAEDTGRTELYRQEAARVAFRATAASPSAFLASLRLKIDVATVRAGSPQAQRIAQLTERTNQFVSYKEVLSEAAVDAFIMTDGRDDLSGTPPPTVVLAVSVTDRFGHYGLIASALLCTDPAHLFVGGHAVPAADTPPFLVGALLVRAFLMSCRVLHRGVEHALVRRLADEAARRGKDKIAFRFVPSERNHIGEKFLRALPGALFFPASHGCPEASQEHCPTTPGLSAAVDSDSDVELPGGAAAPDQRNEEMGPAEDGSYPAARGPCGSAGRLVAGWVTMDVGAAANFDLDPDVALGSEPTAASADAPAPQPALATAVAGSPQRPLQLVGDGARLWLHSDTYAAIAAGTATTRQAVAGLAALGVEPSVRSPLEEALAKQLQEAATQSAANEQEQAVQRACMARRQLRHAIKVGVHEANAANPTFVAPQGPVGAGDSYF